MKIAVIVNRKGKKVETVRENQSLMEAVDLMHRKAVGSVIVCDSKSGGILGLVAQTEIVAATAARGANALTLPVLLFMRRPAVFCRCRDDAASVLTVMTRERCRHIIVRDEDGALAGVVSIGDLVAALLEEAQLEAGVLRDMARSHLLALPA